MVIFKSHITFKRIQKEYEVTCVITPYQSNLVQPMMLSEYNNNWNILFRHGIGYWVDVSTPDCNYKYLQIVLGAFGYAIFFIIFKITTIEEIYFLKLSFDGLKNLRQNRKKSWIEFK